MQTAAAVIGPLRHAHFHLDSTQCEINIHKLLEILLEMCLQMFVRLFVTGWQPLSHTASAWKLQSGCGYIRGALGLRTRTWTCLPDSSCTWLKFMSVVLCNTVTTCCSPLWTWVDSTWVEMKRCDYSCFIGLVPLVWWRSNLQSVYKYLCW